MYLYPNVPFQPQKYLMCLSYRLRTFRQYFHTYRCIQVLILSNIIKKPNNDCTYTELILGLLAVDLLVILTYIAAV